MIALALKLVLAHLLGDFALQPDSWVKDKEAKKHKSLFLYLHIAIHAMLLLAVMQFQLTTYWEGIVTIVITHLIIDLLKAHISSSKNYRFMFFIDQLLHVLVIALVVRQYTYFPINLEMLFRTEVLLFTIFVILSTLVSSIIMKMLISKWEIPEYNTATESLKNAGAYIGMLERLFVFLFIMIGRWEAIGFLLTAKSVFRYGDLANTKNRKLTEYVLIGTLLSFGLAMLYGITYKYLVGFV